MPEPWAFSSADTLAFVSTAAARAVFRIIAILSGLLAFPHGADLRPTNAVSSGATRLNVPGLQNTFRVTERIFSGSQPDTETAFAALAELGVKTVVSVDGNKPDVEAAHKFGLIYVHLPIGYGPVPTNRVAELAKLMTLRPGPFYVHCRHGIYRGPTAVALMCEGTDGWSSAQAVAWLGEVGASLFYPGLYRSVREFKKPSAAELNAVMDLPETVESSSLVKRMVSMDQHFSGLKQAQKSGWLTPDGHADAAARRHAAGLWDQLRKLYRTNFLNARPEDFQGKMLDALKAAENLHTLLSAKVPGKEALDTALERTAETCATCHGRYRDQ